MQLRRHAKQACQQNMQQSMQANMQNMQAQASHAWALQDHAKVHAIMQLVATMHASRTCQSMPPNMQSCNCKQHPINPKPERLDHKPLNPKPLNPKPLNP